MEMLLEEMSKDLAEIWTIQKEIQDGATMLTKEGVEDRLRKLLERVRKLVEKYAPETYSVSVGFPLGASVSFTWSGTEEKP